jgi:hypothetical protein
MERITIRKATIDDCAEIRFEYHFARINSTVYLRVILKFKSAYLQYSICWSGIELKVNFYQDFSFSLEQKFMIAS